MCSMFGFVKCDILIAGFVDGYRALAPERLEAACALARRLAEKF